MINSIFNKGNIPLLEKAISFSYQRHNVIANNIANATTPGFKALDLPEKEFMEYLEKALQESKKRDVNYMEFESVPGGSFTNNSGVFTVDPVLTPEPGVMSHNGNNVDVDRENAKLAKNALYYSVLVQLLRNNFDSLKSAIAEKAT